MKKEINFYPVILAGGRGTRFWPLSRKKRAKQLLALDGKETMIQQTLARLLPLASARKFWIITNQDLRPAIAKQLPRVPKNQLIAEPIARNTAPAIGLAAFLLLRQYPSAVLGLFPSDHVIADDTEKPDATKADEFVNAGNYFWNSGMFLWSARTLADALKEHLPVTATLLEEIAATFGTNRFPATFRKLYPKCENISVDYAVLEPRSAKGEEAGNIFCLPADFGWNDLGSWTALHEHQTAKSSPPEENVMVSSGTFLLNARGNYVHAPGKFVAAVGVTDLVVVETPDALLITTRQQAQDVGKIVKYLDEKKMTKLT
ncbi:MAG: mannose-1-phosphate guanyltransferase [Acidobacteria bacterium 13_1_20CM_4_56_7]|nr:MAG: mannose-1-phosphate guanyltransferase [Acidobacteria bacterium 13_1_20CM_4_56_7]